MPTIGNKYTSLENNPIIVRTVKFPIRYLWAFENMKNPNEKKKGFGKSKFERIWDMNSELWERKNLWKNNQIKFYMVNTFTITIEYNNGNIFVNKTIPFIDTSPLIDKNGKEVNVTFSYEMSKSGFTFKQQQQQRYIPLNNINIAFDSTKKPSIKKWLENDIISDDIAENIIYFAMSAIIPIQFNIVKRENKDFCQCQVYDNIKLLNTIWGCWAKLTSTKLLGSERDPNDDDINDSYKNIVDKYTDNFPIILDIIMSLVEEGGYLLILIPGAFLPWGGRHYDNSIKKTILEDIAGKIFSKLMEYQINHTNKHIVIHNLQFISTVLQTQASNHNVLTSKFDTLTTYDYLITKGKSPYIMVTGDHHSRNSIGNGAISKRGLTAFDERLMYLSPIAYRTMFSPDLNPNILQHFNKDNNKYKPSPPSIIVNQVNRIGQPQSKPQSQIQSTIPPLLINEVKNNNFKIGESFADGRCLYSSIFRAATNQGIIDDIEKCINFERPTNKDHEPDFIRHFRRFISARIINNYNSSINTTYNNIYKGLFNNFYEDYVNNYVSKKIYEECNSIELFLEKFKDLKSFKTEYARICELEYEYVYQPVVEIVLSILQECGYLLYIVDENNRNSLYKMYHFDTVTLKNSIILERSNDNHYKYFSFNISDNEKNNQQKPRIGGNLGKFTNCFYVIIVIIIILLILLIGYKLINQNFKYNNSDHENEYEYDNEYDNEYECNN